MRLIDIVEDCSPEHLAEYFQPREPPTGQDSIYTDMITNTIISNPKLRRLAAAMVKNPSPRTGIALKSAIEHCCSKWLRQVDFRFIDADTAINAAMMDILQHRREEVVKPVQQAASKPAQAGPSMMGKLAQRVGSLFQRPNTSIA